MDFPGLNDGYGRDAAHLDEMVTELRELRYITAFIIVLNGQLARMTKVHWDMLDILRGIFGIDLFSNSVLVFTHWPKDDISERRRRAAGVSEDAKRTQINQ